MIMAMVRAVERLWLGKPLAHAMGLRRRDLRAMVQRMIDEGAALQFLGRNVVRPVPGQTTLTLDLQQEQIQTLILALRMARQAAHTRQSVVEAAEILHRIAGQLPPHLFADFAVLGGFDVAPVTVDDDGRPSTRTRNLVVQAIREERKMHMLYPDATGARTDRVVWPVTLTYHGSTLVAWCETRAAFRHFRLDSIAAPDLHDTCFDRSRAVLLAELRAALPDRSTDSDSAT